MVITTYIPYKSYYNTIVKTRSVIIVRMEVPCCGGLQRAAQNALQASGKFISWQVVTISRDGIAADTGINQA